MNNSIKGMNFHYVGFTQRVIAFALDFLIIGGYILFLFGVGVSINAVTGGISLLDSPLAMNMLAFIAIVLPVILYFALQERSSFQATWGKRLVKIKVINSQGARLSTWQALLRSAIKFLPWQLAHMSIIYIWFGNQSPIFMAGALISQGLLGVYVLFLLFSKKHQTVYDWIAGTYEVFAE